MKSMRDSWPCVLLLGLGLAGLACSSSSSGGGISKSSDGGTSNDAADASARDSGLPACTWPANLGDAAPGVIACSVGRAAVWCHPEAGVGVGCGCITDDPTSCPGCESPGYICQDSCGPNEYAVACGGPPAGNYQDVPDACVVTAYLPSGAEYACCPCQ